MARSKTIWLYTPENLALMDPTPLRSRLAPLKFDGERGIVKSERDDVLQETRFDFLFTKKRAISFRSYDGGLVERELSYEKVYTLRLRFNVRLDLLIVESSNSSVVEEVVEEVASALGCSLTRQSFDAIAMNRLVEMAEDVRKARIHSIEDPYLRDLQLKGDSLSSSKPFKSFRSKGKVKELVAKVSLPSGALHTVALNSNGKMRVSRRGGELSEEDLFHLIGELAD